MVAGAYKGRIDWVDPMDFLNTKEELVMKYMVIRGDDNGNMVIIKRDIPSSSEAEEVMNKVIKGHKQFYSIRSYADRAEYNGLVQEMDLKE